MDHHLVPASETRLRIMRHLTAAAADTRTWTHLELKILLERADRGNGM